MRAKSMGYVTSPGPTAATYPLTYIGYVPHGAFRDNPLPTLVPKHCSSRLPQSKSFSTWNFGVVEAARDIPVTYTHYIPPPNSAL